MIKYFFLGLCFVSTPALHPLAIQQTGRPWQHTMQPIPGRVQCELYDEGGEGVAYHDNDSINNGSGKLNPANGNFLNEFRMHEGVDISFTKTGSIDDNPFNKTVPVLNQLYLGWTQPGEWVNYTIQAKESGRYRVGLMYTSNAGGVIALDIDGMHTSGQLVIPTTYDARDTVAWRQWHHWNKIDSLTSLSIKKGIHQLTLHIVEQGNMNFDYLEFSRLR